MKILLIDDEANLGWKEVLEKVLLKSTPIDTAISYEEAEDKLDNEIFDLIFLDLRFGETDHSKISIKEFGGYKILNNLIRASFEKKNFVTPIILFTASNKAWNIFEMLECGVDDFYIKEHPDSGFDPDFSRQNYTRLKESVPKLTADGAKRREIWNKINVINNSCQTSIINKNRRLRITEKLRIGYGLLFRKTSKLENQVLLFNNEIMAFIVFWSILEEISHDFYNRIEETNPNWILDANNKVQWLEANILSSKFASIADEVNSEIYKEFEPKRDYQINLSNQIAGILRYKKGWNHHQIHLNYLKKFNKYRNDIDFIHSSTDSINSKSLNEKQLLIEGFKKTSSFLDFLILLLN